MNQSEIGTSVYSENATAREMHMKEGVKMKVQRRMVSRRGLYRIVEVEDSTSGEMCLKWIQCVSKRREDERTCLNTHLKYVQFESSDSKENESDSGPYVK